jgi:hypothetical protein
LAVEVFSQITRAALRGEPVKNGKTFWIGSGPVVNFPLMTKGGSLPAMSRIQSESNRETAYLLSFQDGQAHTWPNKQGNALPCAFLFRKRRN